MLHTAPSNVRISGGIYQLSSYKSNDIQPWYARLGSSSSWCADPSDSTPYLQIDFLEIHKITAILMKGDPSLENAYNFTVSYRLHKMNNFWTSHKELETVRVRTIVISLIYSTVYCCLRKMIIYHYLRSFEIHADMSTSLERI